MADRDEGKRRAIRRVKASLEDELLAKPGVTAVDIDYKVTGGERTDALSIVVYVEKKKDVPAKERIPAEIDGIPTDVVEDKIVPHQNMVRVEDIVIQADTGTYTPLVGGISIGPCRSFHLTPPEVATEGDYVFTGTLGCIVRDVTTDAAMALSNFHVMCVDDTWAVGDAMAQPSLVDTGSCPSDTIGTLQRAVLNQDVDCAVSSISGRQVSCAVTEIGDITGTAVAVVDEAVRKRGRTTGLTHGTIASVDYSTNVDYGDGLGTVTLKNQIRIVPDTSQSSSFGNKGDSGSVVVNASGEVVGLYFAGNSSGTTGVANPIAAVLSALNVKVCTGLVKKLETKEILTKEHLTKELSPEKRFYEEKEFFYEKRWKERFKEVAKDDKEWGYEKFDFEGKAAALEGSPWERPPVDPWRPGIPTVPGQVPIGPRGAASLEERVAAIESMLTGEMPAASLWPPLRRPCADLSVLPVGPVSNPLGIGPVWITVFDYTGAQPPQGQVVSWGGRTGLNVGFRAELALRGCPVVQLTLAHFSQPPTAEAWNADGTYAGSASMGAAQNQPQTLTISGTAITRVVIRAPANETILMQVCCCARVDCAGPVRPDIEKPIRETGHFIPPELRPDLGRGALGGEPQMPYQGRPGGP